MSRQLQTNAQYRTERVKSVFKETRQTYITAELEKQRTEIENNHMLSVTIL